MLLNIKSHGAYHVAKRAESQTDQVSVVVGRVVKVVRVARVVRAVGVVRVARAVRVVRRS